MDIRSEFSIEHYNAVSQEIAVLDKFKEVGTNVKDSVLNFVHVARQFVKDKLNKANDVEAKNFTSYNDSPAHKKVVRYLNEVSYYNTRELTVFIPPGFVGNYSSYLDTLLDGKEYFANLDKDVLNPAKAYVGKLISDPNALNGAGAFKLSPERVVKWAGSTSEFFGNNIATDMVKFGDIFNSNLEYLDAYSKATALNTYAKDITEVKVVRERANELAALFDRLIVKIESSPGQYKVNGNNAQSITDLAYALAKTIEYYGAFISMSNAALIALERTELKIKKIA